VGRPTLPAGDPSAELDHLPTRVQPASPSRPRGTHVPPGTIERARLLAALDAGTQTPLTVITGPAGTGKTTLVGSWAQTREREEFVWIALDRGGPREQVWRLVLDGFVAAGVAEVRSVQVAPIDVLLADLGAALGRHGSPIVLVLDDTQEVTDPAVRDEFLQLARWRMPELRVVVISRHESSLRIQRMLLSGAAWHIAPDELAFTPDEARALFAAAEVAVDDERLAGILARTSGWAAGLGLAVLGLRRGQPAPRPGAGSGADAAMSDYLFQEVIERLDPEDREFLLQTSIVGAVSGGLADAITGQAGSGGRLEDLRRRGFPLTTSGSREWYRAHPALVGDYLRDELRRGHGKDEIDALHRRAARWLAANDDPVSAVDHAMTAGASDLAVELVEDHFFALLLAGHLGDVVPVLAADADGVVARSPMVGCAVARAALQRGDLPEADRWLELADRTAGASAAPERQDRIAVARLVVLLERAHLTGELAATRALSVELAGRLDALEHDLPQARTLRALVDANLGGEELWHGDAGLVAGSLTAAREEHDGPEVAAVVGIHAARGQLRAGRLAEADVTVAALLAAAATDAWPEHDLVTAARTVRATAALRRSDLVAAAEDLVGALAGPRPAHPLIEADRQLASAELLRRSGRPEDALAALALVDVALQEMDPAGRPHARRDGQLALTLLAAGRPAEAARAATGDGPERAVTLAAVRLAEGATGEAYALAMGCFGAPSGAPDVAEAMSAHVIAALATPDEAERPTLLDQALALGASGGLRSPLDLLASPALTAILVDLQAHGTVHALFVDQLLQEGEPVPERPATGLAEPLSVRELDVLRFLPTTLSGPEIADRLYLSANTIKSHLKHIYAKLDVGSRRDAVMRARHEGLLPGRV